MIGKRIAGALLALGPSIACASRYNLQDPNSALGQSIYDLHNMILWVCLLIFVGVFGVMFYAVFKHRKSTATKPTPESSSKLGTLNVNDDCCAGSTTCRGALGLATFGTTDGWDGAVAF